MKTLQGAVLIVVFFLAGIENLAAGPSEKPGRADESNLAGKSRAAAAKSSAKSAAKGPSASGAPAANGRPQERAVPVLAADVVETTVPLQISAVGNVQPCSVVQIKAQVSGQVTKIHFREGQEVRRGDLLFTLDSRTYVALLKKEEANLASNKVEAQNAQVELKRVLDLLKTKSAATEEVDQARTNAESKAAQVEASQAAVEYAQLQVGYCTLTSPIDGRTGAIGVHPGNLVTASNSPTLVEITQITPIYVAFSVSEQYLPMIQRRIREGARLRAEVVIPGDDEGAPLSGELFFVDSQVDRETGTILLKAILPNKDHRLWPGQYVNVNLILLEEPNRVLIPSQAIQVGQSGTYVFVIRPDLTVEQRSIQAVRTLKEFSVIESGLHGGERVVIDGQLRLVAGAKVEIKRGLRAGDSSSDSQANTTP